MTIIDAKNLVQKAIDLCHKEQAGFGSGLGLGAFESVPRCLLRAADSLGYVEPDLAVKQACLALYDELRAVESRLTALASGTLLATTPA